MASSGAKSVLVRRQGFHALLSYGIKDAKN